MNGPVEPQRADKTNLLGLDRSGMEAFFTGIGEKSFRAHQVMKWMYHQRVRDFDQMTDLGKVLRAKLREHAQIAVPAIESSHLSADGTQKWLLAVPGANVIETVFIPEPSRGTLCVSSQVGCGLNCTFCATARQGFSRNLSAAEIVGQVWIAAHALGNVPHHMRKLTNIVMMGMGEPLLNFEAVVQAMSVMRDDLGFGLANKRVTLSTAGLVPMIDLLAEKSDVSLAVSLHAPFDELRNTLVPLNKKYPIAILLDACKRYAASKPRSSITFEYTLIKGVNDRPEHAKQLLKLLRPLPSKLNLIPFNPVQGIAYERSDPDDIRHFQKIILDGGLLATVRRTRGEDINAACGQLAGKVMDKTRRSKQYQDSLKRPRDAA